MKRILAFILAAITASCLFAGCGTEEIATEDGLQVAVLEAAYSLEMWKQVCDAFTAQTGIKVNLTACNNQEDVLSADADVVHAGQPSDLTKQYIVDKKLYDLSGVLSVTIPGESVTVADKMENGFLDTAVTMPYGDGKTYLMPMFYSPRGFFYNIELFAKNRWTVPATWEDMWLFAENAKSNGMYLFTYPKAEYLESFLYALMYSVGGADFFNGVMTGQEGIWDTKDARNFVKILGKLASYTHPDTASNANDASYKNNQLMIMFDETLFMPNGKEVSNDMQVEEQSHYRPFGWGMSAFPAAVEGGCGYTYCTVEQLWIPADAVKKTEAEQFVAFMYSDNAAKIFATKGAVQPIKGISSIVDSSAKIFYSLHDNGAKAALGGGSLDPVYIESFNQLVDGTINTNQYLANVKEAGDRMRAELAG